MNADTQALQLESLGRRRTVPFQSRSQMRWGNSPAGHAALGDAGVNEWNAATKGMKLPEKKLGRKFRKPGLRPAFGGGDAVGKGISP